MTSHCEHSTRKTNHISIHTISHLEDVDLQELIEVASDVLRVHLAEAVLKSLQRLAELLEVLLADGGPRVCAQGLDHFGHLGGGGGGEEGLRGTAFKPG